MIKVYSTLLKSSVLFSVSQQRCSPHGFASGGIRSRAEKYNRAVIRNNAEKVRQGVKSLGRAFSKARRDPRGGAPGRPPQRAKHPLPTEALEKGEFKNSPVDCF